MTPVYTDGDIRLSATQFSCRRIRRREKRLRFEIMRLDDIDGTAVDSTVVDAASVNRIVQQAAFTGQRIYIRPADTDAAS
ncbi:hypothetical protein QFZ68_004595 [Streptomyces sp. V1I6]|nr:hypothetical protein [Streptomyces sp. V1I6]